MSPARFEVEKAQLNRDLERARLAGDLPGMQAALSGLTSLYRAYYGHPLAA